MAFNRDLPIKKRILAEHEESKKNPPKHVKVDVDDQDAAATLTTKLPTTTSVNAGIFKRPLPVAKQKKNPLRTALEIHFQNMNPETRAAIHFGEILRLIADYYRLKRHSFSDAQKDMLAVILFLYEKSCIIEPLNNYAKQNYESYAARLQPQFNALVFVEGTMRKSKYLSEKLNLGNANFFWLSIDKFIERLQRNFGKNSAQELAELCTHLTSTESVQHMRHKHMTPDQQEIAAKAFASSIETLTQETILQFKSTHTACKF